MFGLLITMGFLEEYGWIILFIVVFVGLFLYAWKFSRDLDAEYREVITYPEYKYIL